MVRIMIVELCFFFVIACHMVEQIGYHPQIVLNLVIKCVVARNNNLNIPLYLDENLAHTQ